VKRNFQLYTVLFIAMGFTYIFRPWA